jgi:rhodanese-related sulfurtransferase
MTRQRMLLILLVFMFFGSTAAMAQYPVIDAEQLKSRLQGKQKVILIDARPEDEYQQGHIPGAINIRSDRMKEEYSRLPKNKTTALIFYCRGEG